MVHGAWRLSLKSLYVLLWNISVILHHFPMFWFLLDMINYQIAIGIEGLYYSIKKLLLYLDSWNKVTRDVEFAYSPGRNQYRATDRANCRCECVHRRPSPSRKAPLRLRRKRIGSSKCRNRQTRGTDRKSTRTPSSVDVPGQEAL